MKAERSGKKKHTHTHTMFIFNGFLLFGNATTHLVSMFRQDQRKEGGWKTGEGGGESEKQLCTSTSGLFSFCYLAP